MGATSLIALLGALAAPQPAASKCQAEKIAEFPITMAGRSPIVDARFGDKAARFILDSGAFYSTISRASAAEFGLKVSAAPPWFRLRGIGGTHRQESQQPTLSRWPGSSFPKSSSSWAAATWVRRG